MQKFKRFLWNTYCIRRRGWYSMTDNIRTDKQLEQERDNGIMRGVARWTSFYRSN